MTNLRDFLFRGLMFEAEAEKFRKAGLRVGADSRDAEASLLEEVLQPFDVSMRNAALLMSRLYALIYCFENSVRDLIADRLSDKHGVNWWDQRVPQKVRDMAKSKQDRARKESWLEGQKKDLLGFVDFGDLCTIIVNNWADFTDLVPSQHWLKQRMDELEMSRHFIAHNRLLLPAEFQRIYMYIADWNRMVGL
jgi:hypothetical protein